MFTGIIEVRGTVHAVRERSGTLRIEITKPRKWKLRHGESIAIDGICSTVIAGTDSSFAIEYIQETLSKTTAGAFKKGSVVNLERSLTLKTRLDGHVVQGHVDDRASIVDISKVDGAFTLAIKLPKELVPYAPPRGAITVNGVSLTVARASGATITVAIIPYTLAHTNLEMLAKGDRVNIEVDLMARYGAHILKHARLVSHAKKTGKKSRA